MTSNKDEFGGENMNKKTPWWRKPHDKDSDDDIDEKSDDIENKENREKTERLRGRPRAYGSRNDDCSYLIIYDNFADDTTYVHEHIIGNSIHLFGTIEG